MSLPPAFLDELRARTTLSALIGRTVKLQRAGSEFKACCPFHKEKTASFYVNDEKGFYHCFGCSAHGDAMRWLMETRGLEFLGAVRELADAAGMQVPERSQVERDQAERNAGMYETMARAQAWFHEQLASIEGGEARRYLQGRQITSESIRAFGLGFAPDSRSALRLALSEIGDRALLEAGLLVQREDDSDPYSRFRGRAIFPIQDAKGRVIAFGGRILGPGEPKYLNSPETALFEKGRTLFNLHRAAPAARMAGRLLVVEGQMDVIGLAQIGVAETVASSGTALTEAQLGQLWRVSPSPILCFDGDGAGQRACAKAAIRALPSLGADRTLSFALLPPGQDPDDLARSGGRDAIETLIGGAIPLVELLWRHEHGAEPLRTPEARAALRERLVAHARSIEDTGLAREYEQDFRQRVDRLFEKAKRPARGKPAASPALSNAAPNPGPQITRKLIVAVLRGAARFPSVAADRSEQLSAIQPRDKAIEAGLELLMNAIFEQREPDVAAIDALFPEERGWRGFSMSFLRPDAWERRAIADLEHIIDMLACVQAGVAPEELARLAREYRPPERPEAGKLV